MNISEIQITKCLKPFIRTSILLYVLGAVGSAFPQAAISGIGNTTSTPIPGVPHDYLTGLNEIVNPANGSLSIRIKAPTPHERGVNWPTYVYVYDSNGQFMLKPTWQVVNTGSRTIAEMSQLYYEPAFTLPDGQPQIEAVTLPTGQYTSQEYGCLITNTFMFTDPDGGLHPLDLGVAAPYTGGGAVGNCSPFASAVNEYIGGDEQYKAYVTNPNSNPVGFIVVDTHGSIVRDEDANGNYFNSTGRAWSTTQTSTGATLTIPGVSGQYTITNTAIASPSFTIHSIPVSGTTGCEVTSSTFYSSSGFGPGTTKVTLPNGESYQFQFDPVFGLINKITYPTGAWVQYTWSVISAANGTSWSGVGGTEGSTCSLVHDWYAITKRVISNDGATSDEEQDFAYTTTWPGGTSSPTSYNWTSKQTTITTKDLLRNTSFQTIYTYSPMTPPPVGPSYAPQTLGVVPQENTIAYYDANGSLLKTTTKTWQTINLMSGECETLPNGQTSGKFYQYQPYAGFNNYGAPINPGALWTDLPTDVAEFDYGAVSSTCAKPTTTPLRETKTSYQSFSNSPLFPFASILDRPSQVQVYGNGTMLSQTNYYYDQTSPAYVAAYGHDDTNYGSGSTAPRGNPTTVTKQCFVGSTSCTASTTTYTYDTTGQIITAVDACGNTTCSDMSGTTHTTTYSYTDNYTNGAPPSATNAYVTKITDPAGHTTQYQWGYQDGKMWSRVDNNSQTTKYCYTMGGCGGSTFDPFYRLTQVIYPDSGQETISYSDAGPTPSVSTNTLISGSTSLNQTTNYNAMGLALTKQITSDPYGTDITTTTYDGLSHVWTATNPYRSTSDTTYGTITYTYDALGRTTTQKQQDGNTLTWCYDGLKTQGQSNCLANQSSKTSYTWVDYSDEDGHHFQRVSDALGRLAAVMEPNSSNSPANETDYGYDALGNLLRVDQWGGAINSANERSRTFSYDSLSRLQSAANSETETVTYTYDANSNTQSKKDARGITASYTYDILNRLLTKSYSDGTFPSCYSYDSISTTNGIGRLASEWTQTGTCSTSGSPSSFFTLRSVLAYDAMGRIKSEQQCTPTKCAANNGPQLWYGYDLAGNNTCLINSAGSSQSGLQIPGSSSCSASNVGTPSGLVLTPSYDAAMHFNGLVSNWTAYSTSLYTLDSFGPVGPLSWTLGSNLSLAQGYTNRLWTNSITATGQVP